MLMVMRQDEDHAAALNDIIDMLEDMGGIGVIGK